MTKKEKERARGVLTTADREFLRGERTYKHRQTVSDRRRKIRERIYNSLLDFSILFEELDDIDRKQVFDVEDDDVLTLQEALIDLIAFVVICTNSRVEMRRAAKSELGDHNTEFGQVLDRALYRAYLRYDVLIYESGLYMDLQHIPNLEQIYRRLRYEYNITPEHMKMLILSGQTDDEVIEELLQYDLVREEMTE